MLTGHRFDPVEKARAGILPGQLEQVAGGNFRGRDDLLLLELIPTKLAPETKYEQGGEEKYPHIYGPINKEAVNRTIEVRCNADGLFDGVFDKL